MARAKSRVLARELYRMKKPRPFSRWTVPSMYHRYAQGLAYNLHFYNLQNVLRTLRPLISVVAAETTSKIAPPEIQSAAMNLIMYS